MSLKDLFSNNSVQLEELKDERDMYKKKSQALAQELYTIKESISTESDSNRTSFVTQKIQKIEALEAELETQKSRAQEAKYIAQEANQVKQEFLANINHEIQTPINSIIKFSDMLSKKLQDKTELSYAKNIFTLGHKLLTMMDNIIELSLLESRVFELENRAVAILPFIDEIVKEYEKKASNKGLGLSVTFDEDIPESLMLDDKKVRSILENLLDNAIKFTTKGEVEVRVVVEEYNIAQNRLDLAISVTDTGMGVDTKNHEKIFEIFEKKENGNDVTSKGIGFGLSISKKMATLMNGDITLSSKFGEGSTFTLIVKGVEIILRSAEDMINESDIDFTPIKTEGGSVMVIDDENSCSTIKEAFFETHVEVMVYSNPREAMEVLKVEKFDMLFIDVNILNTDNGAVSKVIAKMTQAPVVSLTSTRTKDLECIKDGANIVGHLKKPIAKLELFKIALKTLNV